MGFYNLRKVDGRPLVYPTFWVSLPPGLNRLAQMDNGQGCVIAEMGLPHTLAIVHPTGLFRPGGNEINM